ncbi:MAG: arylsulfatase, partial [Planctomycetota bacterium]
YYTEPLCTPARAAILTGRYPLRYGLHAGNVRPWARHGLPPDERTLAEALRDAGYATSIVGKWHLGYARQSLLPRSQGFDHQYGCYQGSIDYYEHTHGNFGGLDWHRDGVPLREKGYATDLIADEAIRQITNHDPDTPFFLYLAFTAAHGPYAAPEECAQGYDFISDAEHRAYAGVLTCLDRAVGRVVDALDQSALADNALLVFCADNGSGFDSTAPGADTRHGKGTMYEGALRVPAIVRWRGRLDGGRSVATPVHAVDWYPTLVRLAGGSLDQPRPVDGVDIWPAIARGEPLDRDCMLLSYDGTQGALRCGDWKLVSRTLGKMRTTELYDVAHDLSERSDVADAHAELVAELTRALDRFAAAAAEPLYERKPESFTPPAIWQPIEP